MKTHVITVSQNFPTTHKKAGQGTEFIESILTTLDEAGVKYCTDEIMKTEEFLYFTRHDYTPKIHTIRSNFEYWAKRIAEVQKGEAILSIRYWSEKPYNSKQVTICNLTKEDGVGIQKLVFENREFNFPCIDNAEQGLGLYDLDTNTLSQNDGLSLDDFKEWFKKYDLSEPMGIIHFTDFRY